VAVDVQAWVQFACDANDGLVHYAIKCATQQVQAMDAQQQACRHEYMHIRVLHFVVMTKYERMRAIIV
jgi:hypothetical protein